MKSELLKYVTEDEQYGYSAWWHYNDDYDSRNDHTSGDWYVLREGIDLRETIDFLLGRESGERIYLRILSHEEYMTLGDAAEELMTACDEKKIHILREESKGVFYDYMKKHPYHIIEYTGYGAVDDAASVIIRSYEPLYSEQEQAEIDARLQKERRQRDLAKGKEFCKKYMVFTLFQVNRKLFSVNNKLEKQIKMDPDPKTLQCSVKESLDIFYKQRKLRERILELEMAKEYLLHRDELV